MLDTQKKILLRKTLKQKTRDFYNTNKDSGLIEAYATDFFRILCTSTLYTDAGSILCYHALPGEAPTENIIMRSLSEGKNLALPKINGNAMDFFFIENNKPLEMQLTMNSFGIAEPSNAAPVFDSKMLLHNFLDTAKHVLVIVPALAVTKSGIRLGRGGGFYDRYLANLLHARQGTKKQVNTVLCALCYAFQIEHVLPYEKHDVYMDYILTENALIACNKTFCVRA